MDDPVPVRDPAPARVQREPAVFRGPSCVRPCRSPTCSDRAAQSARQVEQVIDALPRYFSQNVITADRRTANIAFGIRTMPLDKQKELVDDMRAQLDPPRGVDAQLAGLPVLAADAHAQLESSRWWLALAGLAAVFLRAARRLPQARGRRRAAHPDRARNGLVVAAAVRPADPAEPDVGHPGRAGDRDLDRVRGDPLARATGPSARGAWSRRQPCREPTSARARRCSHPASPRSRASVRCWSATSRCCATSGP